MNIDQDPRISAAYTTRLDQTLQDLQDRVKEQEAALVKVTFHTLPNRFLKISS